MNNSYQQSAQYADTLAFSRWQAAKYELSPEELLEERKEELRKIVRRVIRQELSDFDRRLVELHWYKGVSKSEIARLMNVDRSTIHRHFTAINKTVYDKLRYAVELVYGSSHAEDATREITETVASFSPVVNSEDISRRLVSLRAKKQLSVDELSRRLPISKSRLVSLERRGSRMTLYELKEFTKFYKVDSNYIIFGTDCLGKG